MSLCSFYLVLFLLCDRQNIKFFYIDVVIILLYILIICTVIIVELYVLFIDFSQAFVSLRRDVLLNVVNVLCIPATLLKLINVTLRLSRTTVITMDGVTNDIETDR